jgi:cytochrome c oxidase subunit 2
MELIIEIIKRIIEELIKELKKNFPRYIAYSYALFDLISILTVLYEWCVPVYIKLDILDILIMIGFAIVIILEFFNDCNNSYQVTFQDPATTVIEGIFLFNTSLIFLIISIIILVGWLLFVIIQNYTELTNTKASKCNHNDFLEIVWTSIPAFILICLASPSFSLLYSLDEISNPELTLKILGHQWYWSYEISDFNCCSKIKNIKYTCYMLTEESLKENNKLGFFRNLETNKRVALPAGIHLRFLISSVDVLHSWTIPSFGIKADACPGRLNQANVFIKRLGLFFGQCSEICGVNHGFMPISVVSLPSLQFHYLVTLAIK